MAVDKPYRRVPIKECGEPMIEIPHGVIAFADPHPYVAAQAPYGNVSPWMLRRSIAQALIQAQNRLSGLKPGWKIKLYDAFRPNAVQRHMVNRAFVEEAKALGLDPDALTEAERDAVEERVYKIWAIPSDDPGTPPPHSTGAVFDCTLQDQNGHDVDMGSDFEENSVRSMPDHFADAPDVDSQKAHANRTLLRDVLAAEGFVRHPHEWWHFSRGDQLATWASENGNENAHAIYGKVDMTDL